MTPEEEIRKTKKLFKKAAALYRQVYKQSPNITLEEYKKRVKIDQVIRRLDGTDDK